MTSEVRHPFWFPALVSGLIAGAASGAALAWTARSEGRHPLQPLNATSHWLRGNQAASRGQADFRHTLVGLLTHFSATIFWAFWYQLWLAWRRPRSTPALVADALALSAIAVVVDYRATPKRFTPGWEFVLSEQSMAATYAAMGLGLAAGAVVTRRGAA